MNQLAKISAETITGLRDALSYALGISVTFTDGTGTALHSDTAPFSRRLVSPLCAKYHYLQGSDIKTNICDHWDSEAIVELKHRDDASSYCKECGLGFECIAVPILQEGHLIGAIFGGEVRIRDKADSEKNKFLDLGIELLRNSNSEWNLERDYRTLFASSNSDEYTVTQKKFDQLKHQLESFVRVFTAIFVDNKFDLEKDDFGLNLDTLTDNVEHISKSISQEFNPGFTNSDLEVFIAIIINGIPSIHKWMAELLDVDQRFPVNTQPTKCNCFVLFVDIRRFSEITRNTPISLIKEARENIFTDIMNTVKKYDGIVDNIVGDALLIFFFDRNVEKDMGVSWIERVANCALELKDLTSEIPNHTEITKDSRKKFDLGIGISYGEVLYGLFNFNTKDGRREYTGIGSVVNKAQRLCQFARRFGNSNNVYGYSPAIVMDEEVKREMQASASFAVKYLDKVQLKGFEAHDPGSGGQKIYSFSPKGETEYGISTSKRYTYLSYGMLSSPKSHVVQAYKEYYDDVKKHGHSSVKFSPHENVAGEIANLLGTGTSNVGFGPNTTHCLNNGIISVIKAIHLEYEERTLDPEIKFVNTDLDHPSIKNLIDQITKKYCTVETINLYEKFNPNITLEQVVKIFSDKVKKWKNVDNYKGNIILFIPHISWSLGLRLPFERIVLAYRKLFDDKLWVIVDGAHALGHISLSLDELVAHGAIDYYATCGHKWLGGPHGTGIYWASPRLLSHRSVENRLASLDTLTHESGIGARVIDTVTGRKEQTATSQRATAHALIRATEVYRGTLDGDLTNSRDKITRSENGIMKLAGKFINNLEGIQSTEFCTKEIASNLEFELLSPKLDTLRCGIVSFKLKGVESVGHRELRDWLDTDNIFVTLLNETYGSDFDDQIDGIRVCISQETEEDDLNALLCSINDWFIKRTEKTL